VLAELVVMQAAQQVRIVVEPVSGTAHLVKVLAGTAGRCPLLAIPRFTASTPPRRSISMFVAVLSDRTIISVHKSAMVHSRPGRGTQSTPEPPVRSAARVVIGASKSTAPSRVCRSTSA
jgi:hypothetical protein